MFYSVKTEGFLKVTDSHVHCKSGNLIHIFWKWYKIEMLLLHTTNSKLYNIACRIESRDSRRFWWPGDLVSGHSFVL